MGSAEEEVIEQASNARRERLRALRAAKDLSDISEDESADVHRSNNTNTTTKEVVATEEQSVEQAAAARRERLKALREAKELLSSDEKDTRQNGSTETEDVEETEEEKRLNMKFRNYLPHDKELQEGKLAPAVLPKFEDPVAAAPLTSEDMEDPFVNIAPKKPNWDLRRDVQKRLDKLERRTMKAIYQLMQEEKEKEAMVGENSVTED
ncbi:coiled-coil domain-containing protein 12 [Iris pallida]|uniref:Coiled-coil domain-containing protein 12 n=1 Tax=Iris pallida TaxID=29817 RepID=A0AAX6HJP4_IRIPA|nr:coiled-coil domain-containing protein 12 [Iris pallida]